MYRREEVISALFGRVGFRQPIQPDYVDILDEENTTSRSGRHFEGFHAMVTIPNIKDVCNGDKAITDEQFNDYLKELQEDCILAVLDGIFDKPEVIEQRMEFDRCDQRPVLMPNVGRFVGRQINIASDPRKSVRINAVTLFFNGDATFNLYLFDNVKKAPIKTLVVTTQADNQVVVTPEDWLLSYMSNASKSGLYFLGYFQDDLGGVQAYDEQPYSWSCGNCYGVRQIEANVVPSEVDFIRYNPFITNRTQGLNIEFSSLVDFTEVIIRSPQAFDKAIGLQMAAMVVERVVHGQRSNGTQRIAEATAGRLYNDLNLDMATPEMPYSSGLKNQLRRELKRLHDNFFPKAKAISTTITDNSCRSIPRHNPWG
jgi:hypothetical protein